MDNGQDVGVAVERGGTILTLESGLPEGVVASSLGFKKLSDKHNCILNDKKATWYIDLPAFEGERDISASHVQKLVDAMRSGEFLADSATLVTADLKGVVYKINGHHTSWAVIYMCEEKPGFSVALRELRYEVKTESDLRLLYSLFDINKPRSSSHLTQVNLAGTGVLAQYSMYTKNKVLPGFKLWLWPSHDKGQRSSKSSRLSPAQVAAYIKDNHLELFAAVCEITKGMHGKFFLLRQPVIAAMFETMSKNKRQAAEFWAYVETGLEMTATDDPRYALREYLQKHSLKDARTKAVAATPEEMYRCCIQAWNHYRAGTKITNLKPTKERAKAK